MDIFVQVSSVEPFIYGKNNVHTPTSLTLRRMAIVNEATMHALIAFAGYHRLLLKDRKANLTHYKDKDDMGQGGREASYRLFEAFRLVQKCFEDPKYALSNVSIYTAMILTACTVSDSFVILRTLSALKSSALARHSVWSHCCYETRRRICG
jgi:hypothetical protein